MDKTPSYHRAATDISEVAATPAPRSLGEDFGPLSLATALFYERITSRSTISTRGRCWSGRVKETRNNRGGSHDGTGARLQLLAAACPATGGDLRTR